MTSRQAERWLARHGHFLRKESYFDRGVMLIWECGNKGIYFEVTDKTYGDAMITTYDHVMGYLYDLILEGGNISNFRKAVRVNKVV